MKFKTGILLLFISFNLFGQAVNEKITLSLSQAALLRVEAGKDIYLEESGTAVIGQSVYVVGGSPVFSYEWVDESGNFYFEKTPEISNTGKYLLSVSDINHCSATDSLKVFPYSTGITANERYPISLLKVDQANKTIYASLEELSGTATIYILDMKGSILLTLKELAAKKNEAFEIPVHGLTPGVYLLMIHGKNKYAASKIILQ